MMNRVGEYFYVPKRARKRKTNNDDKMPTDTGMSNPIKKPLNYSETGPDNSILPDNKVVVKPVKKWVDKFFQPLTVPDQSVGVGNITKSIITPTSIRLSNMIRIYSSYLLNKLQTWIYNGFTLKVVPPCTSSPI